MKMFSHIAANTFIVYQLTYGFTSSCLSSGILRSQWPPPECIIKRKNRCCPSNMELKLEVVLSSSIKRKKPWPRFCWLGKVRTVKWVTLRLCYPCHRSMTVNLCRVTLQEKESVFLLDDKRISEINMVSGRTKKRTPKLHPLLSNVVTMTSSHNGEFLTSKLKANHLATCQFWEYIACYLFFQVCGFADFWSQESFFCGTGIKTCWRQLQLSQKLFMWLLPFKVHIPPASWKEREYMHGFWGIFIQFWPQLHITYPNSSSCM